MGSFVTSMGCKHELIVIHNGTDSRSADLADGRRVARPTKSVPSS